MKFCEYRVTVNCQHSEGRGRGQESTGSVFGDYHLESKLEFSSPAKTFFS